MLVAKQEFQNVLRRLAAKSRLAVDTEATGLRPYNGDRLFSIIIASDEASYYFNFKPYPDLDPKYVLGRGGFSSIFGDESKVIYMHNAKFDLAMLEKDAIYVASTVHCTMACGRLLDSDLPSYSLGALGSRIGFEKSKAVEDNIRKNKLYTEVQQPGKKKKVKLLYYDQVAIDIIVPYGETDGSVTYALGEHQRKRLLDHPLYANECALTKALYRMERAGIRIDRSYCETALASEHKRIERAKEKFEKISGTPFEDTKAVFIEAFTNAGEKIPRTAKGNPCFNKEALASFTTPLADVITEYRDAYKRAGSYFQNFLQFSDDDDMVHADLKQSGCKTGRMSVSEPALQTVNKEEQVEVEVVKDNLVRRAFIPDEGGRLFMIDYNQMEYRAMLDAAGEQKVIDKVNSGLDVHQATADIMHIARKTAKTVNFRLLYGGGAEGLAKALKVPHLDGIDLRRRYFYNLPNVANWINSIRQKITITGRLTNKYGREYQMPVLRAFTGPNAYIQGSCADAIKIAIVRIDELLVRYLSRMLLPVHDEILFWIADGEEDLIPKIVAIMESVWESSKLTLTVGVKSSRKSWAEGVEWNA